MKHIQERILINFPSYLIVLLPLTLISGPFLSDLSIVLIGIFFIINIVLKKEYKYFKNKFIILFSIFTIYLFINSLIKYYDIHSLRSSLGYFRFGIFSLAIWYVLEKNKHILNHRTRIENSIEYRFQQQTGGGRHPQVQQLQ